MVTAISTIVVLGLLIFIHELGHFAVAKWSGVAVYEFSLGFGPKVFGFRHKETCYNLRLLPLGGFVKMAGMDAGEDEREALKRIAEEEGKSLEEINPEDHCIAPISPEQAFNSKSVPTRMAVIAAGPIMNFVLAILLIAGIFSYTGIPDENAEVPNVIGSVMEDSAAEEAGVKPGDKIIAVEGERVTNWEELVPKIQAQGETETSLTIVRDGTEQELTVTPRMDAQKGQVMIGIVPDQPIKDVGFIESLWTATQVTFKFALYILTYLGQMITQQVGAEQLGGPVAIVGAIGEAAQTGFLNLANLAAVLSINLGLLNLLPIPALDGSRLVFLSWEGLRGRPIDPAKENMIHLVGFALLLLLMVFVTYQDITRLFN